MPHYTRRGRVAVVVAVKIDGISINTVFTADAFSDMRARIW